MMFVETNRTNSEQLHPTLYPVRNWANNNLKIPADCTPVEATYIEAYQEWLDSPDLPAFDRLNRADLTDGQVVAQADCTRRETIATDRPPRNGGYFVSRNVSRDGVSRDLLAGETTREVATPHVVRVGLGHLTAQAAGTVVDLELPAFEPAQKVA